MFHANDRDLLWYETAQNFAIIPLKMLLDNI